MHACDFAAAVYNCLSGEVLREEKAEAEMENAAQQIAGWDSLLREVCIAQSFGLVHNYEGMLGSGIATAWPTQDSVRVLRGGCVALHDLRPVL